MEYNIKIGINCLNLKGQLWILKHLSPRKQHTAIFTPLCKLVEINHGHAAILLLVELIVAREDGCICGKYIEHLQFTRDLAVLDRHKTVNTFHLVLMLLRVPGTRYKELLETIFRRQDAACPLLDATLRRSTVRRGACMWTLVTMDPLNNYSLVLGVDNLATCALHGVCSE